MSFYGEAMFCYEEVGVVVVMMMMMVVVVVVMMMMMMMMVVATQTSPFIFPQGKDFAAGPTLKAMEKGDLS